MGSQLGGLGMDEDVKDDDDFDGDGNASVTGT